MQQFRVHPQLNLNFSEWITVDNFAGGGGASTGIEEGLGRPIDIAINHDPAAIALHTVNHPHTREHYCESVWDIDPVKVCAGRPVGLAWFSPDCKHFSKAKGKTPVNKKIRGLAWVVLRWAAKVRPLVIMLENVQEFSSWGPVVKDEEGNYYPCPKRKGRTFKSFINALRSHGYEVEWKELSACDFGAPTSRTRLFLIARCDGQPIAWPEQTHGDPASLQVKTGRLQPWRTAAECIDWSIPTRSIFNREKPLAEKTLQRIAKGIMRYVVANQTPFITPPGTSILGGDHQALTAPFLAEYATAHVIRHFGQSVGSSPETPVGTITAGGMGKTGIVTANLVRNFGRSVGAAVASPVHTITGRSKDTLVSSHLVKLRGTCADGQEVTKPMPTITAGGTHIGEVRAFLVKYYGSDQNPQLGEPLHTITTKGRFGIVTIRGEEYQIADIGMRMLTPRELFRAQGFPENYIIDRDATGKSITQTEQIAKCGNSVCPDMAAALVRANIRPGMALAA